MEQLFSRFLEAVFFPPGLYVLWLVCAWIAALKWPRTKSWAWLSLLLIIYVSSARVFTDPVIAELENTPALTEAELENPRAQAIVVLASGYYHPAPEYGDTTVDDANLIRLRYGAFLQRKTGLPIIVSGGTPTKVEVPLAQVMADVLRDEFSIAEVWLEDRSRTTWENAVETSRIIAEKNIDTVYVVTHAWHMPRAMISFEKAGVNAIPAPTRYSRGDSGSFFGKLIPSASGISQTRVVLHELIGRLWYAIRH